MKQELLLESYLKDLRLSRFVQSYQSLAQEAGRTNLSYERYLLALVHEREGNTKTGIQVGHSHLRVVSKVPATVESPMPLVPHLERVKQRRLTRPTQTRDDSEGGAVFAVRDRNPCVGRCGYCRCDTRHDLKRDARCGAGFRLFATSPEDERIAALQPDDRGVASRQSHRIRP